MKNLAAFTSNKLFLLPAVLTVSFFLVFLGIRTPALPKLQKPNIHHRAVVEIETKVAKAPLTKAENERYVADTCRHIDVTVQPELRTRPPFLEYRIDHVTAIRQLPSRAPPASQA